MMLHELGLVCVYPAWKKGLLKTWPSPGGGCVRLAVGAAAVLPGPSQRLDLDVTTSRVLREMAVLGNVSDSDRGPYCSTRAGLVIANDEGVTLTGTSRAWYGLHHPPDTILSLCLHPFLQPRVEKHMQYGIPSSLFSGPVHAWRVRRGRTMGLFIPPRDAAPH